MTLARLEAVETFKTQAKPPVTPMWLGVASSIMTQWNVYALIKEDASILLLSNTVMPSGSITIQYTPVSVQTRGLELGCLMSQRFQLICSQSMKCLSLNRITTSPANCLLNKNLLQYTPVLVKSENVKG